MGLSIKDDRWGGEPKVDNHEQGGGVVGYTGRKKNWCFGVRYPPPRIRESRLQCILHFGSLYARYGPNGRLFQMDDVEQKLTKK